MPDYQFLASNKMKHHYGVFPTLKIEIKIDSVYIAGFDSDSKH